MPDQQAWLLPACLTLTSPQRHAQAHARPGACPAGLSVPPAAASRCVP